MQTLLKTAGALFQARLQGRLCHALVVVEALLVQVLAAQVQVAVAVRVLVIATAAAQVETHLRIRVLAAALALVILASEHLVLEALELWLLDTRFEVSHVPANSSRSA